MKFKHIRLSGVQNLFCKINFALLYGLLFSLLLINPVYAEIHAEAIEYQAGELTLNGFIAYDSSHENLRPGILVVHEWWGHNEYARNRAKMLAELGYVALAVDMYGEGKATQHPKEAAEFMQAVMKNKDVAAERFNAALETLKQHPMLQDGQIAAIGYCFGGAVVLEMARRGMDLAAVASFHGSLATDNPAQADKIKAKIIVFHGEDDSLIPPESVAAFKEEMAAAEVDLTFINYPGVQHSFTNPDADKFAAEYDLPLAYDADADQDSWQNLQEFLSSIFQASE
jgi:dienelactone hydrolase